MNKLITGAVVIINFAVLYEFANEQQWLEGDYYKSLRVHCTATMKHIIKWTAMCTSNEDAI